MDNNCNFIRNIHIKNYYFKLFVGPTAHVTPSFLKDKKYNTVDNSPTDNALQTQKTHFMTSSDSESPTDPCQTTVAMLRARVVPNNV